MMLILVLVETVALACREFNVGRSAINTVEFHKLDHGVKNYNAVFRLQQFFFMYVPSNNEFLYT